MEKTRRLLLLLSIIAVFSTSAVHAATFTYSLTYDAANRVTQVTAAGTNQVVYTWQDNGQLVSRTRGGDTPVQPLTITVTAPDNGTITAPAANIDCGSTCSGSADQGTVIQLTAVGDTGFAIFAWGDDCAAATGNTCILSMDAAKTVSATFETDQDNDGVGDSSDNCLTTANPQQNNNDGDSEGDACDSDDDNDGMPDSWEIQYNLDPFNPADRDLDPDNDQLTNFEEYQNETNPLIANNQTKFPWTMFLPAINGGSH